jgi:hypothetical protein
MPHTNLRGLTVVPTSIGANGITQLNYTGTTYNHSPVHENFKE